MAYAKFLLLILLINIVCGPSEGASINKRKAKKVLRPMLPEHDNRYVWFTRDIHEDTNIEQHQSEEQHLSKVSSEHLLNILLNNRRQ